MVTIKRKAMKKHNFEQAIEIFKGMFDGWSVVLKDEGKFPLRAIDTHLSKLAFLAKDKRWIHDSQISHLEQTQPMNGDEVWAWGLEYENGAKATYIGKSAVNGYVCETLRSFLVYEKVELITPTRKLTISEATELLKGVVNEPFEIVK